MIELYGVSPSPYCRKVQLAFAFRGIDYNLIHTTPGSEDKNFAEASPLGKIPAIKTEEGHLFADSSVILAYYEKKQQARSLYPEDLGQYARALFLEEYADTKLSDVTSALYFQRVLSPIFFGTEPDAERVNELVNELIPQQLKMLESFLPESGWIIAGEYSIADVSVGALLMNLYHADFEISKDDFPRASNFYQSFLERDDVKAQIETEKRELSHFAQSKKASA